MLANIGLYDSSTDEITWSVTYLKLVHLVSVRYKERYLKACAQQSLCRRYVTQLFEAQLLCNCDERLMT